jgi:predicted O-methyltransferase YrrM
VLTRLKDVRSTNDLMQGVVHVGTWEGRSDRDSDWWNSDSNYQYYAGLASLMRPSSLLEIGVRLGFSLIAVFRGHPALSRIVGIDTEWAIPRSQRLAAENLTAAGFAGKVDLLVGQRDVLHEVPAKDTFDMVHIDGHHSADPVEADIRAAWPRLSPGGVLIADDTTYVPDVRTGIERVRESLTALDHELFFQTFRGWWIAVKGMGRSAGE